MATTNFEKLLSSLNENVKTVLTDQKKILEAMTASAEKSTTVNISSKQMRDDVIAKLISYTKPAPEEKKEMTVREQMDKMSRGRSTPIVDLADMVLNRKVTVLSLDELRNLLNQALSEAVTHSYVMLDQTRSRYLKAYLELIPEIEKEIEEKGYSWGHYIASPKAPKILIIEK